MLVTEELWKSISKEPFEKWGPILNSLLSEDGINTPARVAMFLAQAAHESGGFSRLTENLNYSAAGLAATWPSRFRRPDGQPNDTALLLHRRPELIANNVYANRMGNGGVDSGDGWRYRGRGIFQLTGKSNYQQFFASVNEPVYPEKLSEPEYAIKSAIWYWLSNNLNLSADLHDIESNTRRINGGLNGLTDRISKYESIREYV